MSRKAQRHQWRQTKSGTWSRSFGERGCRVRVFQNRRDGVFFRATWDPEEGRQVKSLGTSDKDEAERAAQQLLAALLQPCAAATAATKLTLAGLCSRYVAECEDFLDNSEKSRKDAVARMRTLRWYFGDGFEVQAFTSDDQRAYERARQQGTIKAPDGTSLDPVRNRTVEADVVVLHVMLRWATTKRLRDGRYLLDRHPLQHVKRVREKNPKRATATWDRYDATIEWLRTAQDATNDQDERFRWLKIEFALFLAYATGRRLGSIRQLRWEDFRFRSGILYWRAEADKKGYRWEIPMPEHFFGEVRAYQHRFGSVGGNVFVAERDTSKITDRHQFDKWLAHAESEAGLTKLDGTLWHAYRRMWAILRKHLPLRDVAEAGGWKDVNTLLKVYQQSDPESLLAVMSETRTLREPKTA